jgi:hypothetical protein
MTEGEKMVWAAAFAIALREDTDKPLNEHIKAASMFADQAINALRFGVPDGDCWRAMVGQ